MIRGMTRQFFGKLTAGNFAVFAFIFIGLVFVGTRAYSQSSTPLTGYLWSDTIGWVSLNCTTDPTGCSGPGGNWGVQIPASSGALSGDAWSDNIGWVSFNSADLTGCPSGPCSATLNSDGTITGWAKALSADNNGWDGWISLSGSNYGLTYSGGTLGGYAWGDVNVGWLAAVNTPVIGSLTVGSGNNPDTPTVTWSGVTGASSCTLTGSNGDTQSNVAIPSGSTQTTPLTGETQYTLTCDGTGGGGPASSAPVNACPAANSCSGGNSVATANDCTQTTTSCGSYGCNASTHLCNSPTCTQTPPSCTDPNTSTYTNTQCQQISTTCPAGCDSGTGQCVTPPSVGSFTAQSTQVASGATDTLSWKDVTNATSCTITGSNGESDTGLSVPSGSITTQPITGTTSYTFTCTGAGGVQSTPITIVVHIAPTYQEI